MKKRIALFLAVVCLLAAFTACGGKKEFVPQDFVTDVLANANFTDSLDRLDDNVVPLLYGIDTADYSEAIVYCGTAATAEEVAVFTAVDSAAADRILDACQARVASQIETYSSYGPVATMALEDSVCQKLDNYVIVVICSDSDSSQKVCNQYL